MYLEMMLTVSQKRSERERSRAYCVLWIITFNKTISARRKRNNLGRNDAKEAINVIHLELTSMKNWRKYPSQIEKFSF
jgi:hypothetical protein